VREYTEQTIASARELGYVQTLLGRRRYMPEIHSSNYNYRQFAERAAVNMPIQGTAADLMKIAMIHVDQALAGASSKMLLQVHDELLFEVPPADVQSLAELVRTKMEDAYPMGVPLKVDVKAGSNWAEMTEVPR